MIKNIKEKAEEYSKNWYQRNGFFLLEDKCRGCYAHILLSYEAGANYVLEQIEEILALKNQYTNKCDFCNDLEWRIEQLKK